MTSALSNRKVFVAVVLLFAVAVIARGWQVGAWTAPTSLTVVGDLASFSGPTLPPGPWDEKPWPVASGPTLPPGPWDEKPWPVASGPTLPPGPWDEKPWPVASGPTLPPGPWDEKPWPVA